ncbi:metal-dependent hydrolase [Sulfurimonas sp.]
MTYKTHVAFAMTAAIPVGYFTNINDIDKIPFLFSVAIGALAPDLDEEGSYLSRRIPVMPMLFSLFGVRHRGVTHRAISVLFLLGLVIGLFFIDPGFESHLFIYFGFVLGYIMHLLGDMMTKGGINDFFFPVSSSKAVLMPRVYRFYTGSLQEYLVFIAIIGVLALEIYFFGADLYKGALIGFL